MRIAQRSDRWMAADLLESLLQFIDEADRRVFGTLCQLVREAIVHVLAGLLAQRDGLRPHRLAADLRARATRLRNPSKYAAFACTAGGEAAPASSRRRSCNRSWSLRIRRRLPRLARRHAAISENRNAAQSVFEGLTFTFEDDRFDYGEHRFVTLGLLAGVPVSIAHTETEHEIHIISFRKATKREAQRYFEEVQD